MKYTFAGIDNYIIYIYVCTIAVNSFNIKTRYDCLTPVQYGDRFVGLFCSYVQKP